MNSFVEKMRQSLSHALVYYYPLAGRFTTVKYEDVHKCSIHVECDKGPGARFIHASALGTGVHVSDIVAQGGYEAPIICQFFDLGETDVVNYDGHTRALLSLQLTELDDGVFVGIAINHSIMDGSSWLHFANSLAEIFRSENTETDHSISNIPIFKPVLPDGCNLIQKLPYLEPEKFITRGNADPRLIGRIFKFSTTSVAKLKSKANLECGGTNSKISSFQALAALIWISITKCKKVPIGETTTCTIPIDCRSRLNPPLSPNHMGNFAQLSSASTNAGELLSKGIGWASNAIHQGIAGYNVTIATQYLKATMENPSIMSIEEASKKAKLLNLVNFVCAAKFDMYGVDYGLGKADAVPSGNIGKRDGTVTLTRGSEGIGSVDIEVFLFPENLNALEADQDFMAFTS